MNFSFTFEYCLKVFSSKLDFSTNLYRTVEYMTQFSKKLKVLAPLDLIVNNKLWKGDLINCKSLFFAAFFISSRVFN